MSIQGKRSKFKPVLVMLAGGGCIAGSTWGQQTAGTQGEALVIMGICLVSIGAYFLVEAFIKKGDLTA